MLTREGFHRGIRRVRSIINAESSYPRRKSVPGDGMSRPIVRLGRDIGAGEEEDHLLVDITTWTNMVNINGHFLFCDPEDKARIAYPHPIISCPFPEHRSHVGPMNRL
jgi:hypothetical protein